jgi:hypothetical protein
MKKAPNKTQLYLNLEEEFKNQCRDDKANPDLFLEESKYLSVPYLSENPKFILIALEPGFGKVEFLKEIDFMGSIKNFLLHYCVCKYLCNGEFDYHFTDISKSAMKSKIANNKGMRNKIYPNWYPLLKKEIFILSNSLSSIVPRIIPLGPEVCKYLKKGEIIFNISDVVYHYGKNNDKIFKPYYNNNFKHIDIDFDTLFENLQIFAEEITSYLSFNQEEKNDRFLENENHKGIFNKNRYTIKQKEQIFYRYLYYKT